MRKIIIALVAVLVCSVSAVTHNLPNYNKLAQATENKLDSEGSKTRQSLLQNKLQLAQRKEPVVSMSDSDLGVAGHVLNKEQLMAECKELFEDEDTTFTSALRSDDSWVMGEQQQVDEGAMKADLSKYKLTRHFDETPITIGAARLH